MDYFFFELESTFYFTFPYVAKHFKRLFLSLALPGVKLTVGVLSLAILEGGGVSNEVATLFTAGVGLVASNDCSGALPRSERIGFFAADGDRLLPLPDFDGEFSPLWSP